MKLSSVFDLEQDHGMALTKMAWSSEADITGLMAGIGSTMLKDFAEKRVTEISGAIGIAVEK